MNLSSKLHADFYSYIRVTRRDVTCGAKRRQVRAQVSHSMRPSRYQLLQDRMPQSPSTSELLSDDVRSYLTLSWIWGNRYSRPWSCTQCKLTFRFPLQKSSAFHQTFVGGPTISRIYSNPTHPSRQNSLAFKPFFEIPVEDSAERGHVRADCAQQ